MINDRRQVVLVAQLRESTHEIEYIRPTFDVDLPKGLHTWWVVVERKKTDWKRPNQERSYSVPGQEEIAVVGYLLSSWFSSLT